MKKVLILLLIMLVTFINIDIKAFMAKKIDLKIKDNETSIKALMKP